jgi:hypothetical protein
LPSRRLERRQVPARRVRSFRSTRPACAALTLPDISPFSSTPVLYFQAPGGGYAPLAPDQIVSTVFVTPPIGVTTQVGYTNYCITVTAVGEGNTAKVQVAVTNTL